MTSKSSSTVPIHGNYHGYYTKRPFIQDPRLRLLPQNLFQNARVLDLGCNEGWVTCEIAQTWGARRVIGVDIDETLVRAAWKRRRTVWSLRNSQAASMSTTGESELLDEEGVVDTEYFPASCEHMFGPLPIPPLEDSACEAASTTFPHNVSFQTADWVHQQISEDTEGYDVVVAFSISKWIHLNNGDEGLTRFFQRVHTVLKIGGVFVLEPQEWDTYAKARRMDPKLRENAKDLKLRPEDFERILQQMGFGRAEHLGKTGEGDLYRKVS
ncbi:Bicoid-interacting protein 3-domain-containing protein [Cristinia sonorae]|uniref:RNA methyltransferase n=1 Tax=Cristinia sonorae TaxID=1940300 RepID=A0A8K0UVY7_9AGAR|nr:Bicoid-interacting protein 3-domain-containing protein [Cristinia sonorae]